MDWHSLEVWSDIVGVASAAAMAVPAWKSDTAAAFMGDIRAALSTPRRGGDPNGASVLADLERRAASWKAPDRVMLRLGVVLLALSFLMRMAHHAGCRF